MGKGGRGVVGFGGTPIVAHRTADSPDYSARITRPGSLVLIHGRQNPLRLQIPYDSSSSQRAYRAVSSVCRSFSLAASCVMCWPPFW